MRVAAPPDAASGKLNRERREEALWSEVRPPLSLKIHQSYFGRQIAEERIRNDKRDQLVRQSVAELAAHKRSLRHRFHQLLAWPKFARPSKRRHSR